MHKKITGELVVRNSARFGLVVSRFNDFITSRLLGAAIDTLLRHGCTEQQLTEVWVPGALELPFAAGRLAGQGNCNAIIALGCVIRGATPHFDHVCTAATRGLQQVGLDHNLPVVLGLLTTNTIEQAVERAGTKAGNKGADAAMTAIEMVNLSQQLDDLGKG